MLSLRVVHICSEAGIEFVFEFFMELEKYPELDDREIISAFESSAYASFESTPV
jgi:hypothetical protein